MYFLFVYTSVGLLPPGESPIAVSSSSSSSSKWIFPCGIERSRGLCRTFQNTFYSSRGWKLRVTAAASVPTFCSVSLGIKTYPAYLCIIVYDGGRKFASSQIKENITAFRYVSVYWIRRLMVALGRGRNM